MKEKIQLLSKGVFEYENPVIEVSEHMIALDVEYGSSYSGYFDVISSNHIEIRAMVFSSNKWMQCLESTMIGLNGRIHYVFDTKGLAVGETNEGCFSIVSNAGELTIPYKVHVCAPYCETSVGRINELDQFASLARENWSEALKIFKSPDFIRVFLGNKKNQRIYEALIKSPDAALAMEEFLCTVKRKQAVSMIVSQKIIEFENMDHVISERLLIEKSQWGHINIQVETQGSFLTIYKKTIVDEDFLGSYYQLEYEVRPEQAALVEGCIVLKTFDQTIEIPVCCRRDNIRKEDSRVRRSLKASWLALNRKYCALEMGQITPEEWLIQAREDIDGCLNNSRESIYRVVEADYLVHGGDLQGAVAVLDAINGRELRYQSVIYYCYYLYVNACSKKDEHYTQYARENIQLYAEGQYKDRWELLMMLIKLDSRETNHAARLFRSLKEVSQTCTPGAAVYMEAVKIVNENPAIIREMGSFETGLFIWGVRHECWNRKAVFQFADLVLRMRHYHPQCLRAMTELCDLYEAKNLLSAVLHLLILGERKEPQLHHWYQLGIKSAIKMPELYEYFMATLDMANCTELPTSVLVYFQYHNRLPLEQKAFLFRYVLEHKNNLHHLFESYDGIIRAFTFEQLQKGIINENIAVLYQYYLNRESLTQHVAPSLPSVIFKHQIHCTHPGIQGVIVDYSEIDREICYPLVHEYAYVDLFMDDYRILFVDEQGRRYMASVAYTEEKLLDAAHYMRDYYDQCKNDQRMLLNRSERALKYQMMDDVSIDIYKSVLKLQNISRHYKKTILKNLVDYYYDNYEGETLEKYLLQIDIQLLGDEERSHIIEYFIQRGLYEKAYKAITVYGYEGIQDKRMMRLCSRIIRENGYEKDDLIVEMAYFAFSKGKYDEVTLQYLIQYYMGTTTSLYAIWKAAQDFEVPAFELEERLLCEILFTETLVAEGCEVFASYYSGHPGPRLIKAFLAYYAYQYLIHDQKAGTRVFQYMEIELEQMDQARDICSMALLKYYAGIDHLETEYYNWIYKEAAAFIDRGMVMPFFKKFAGFGDVPYELVDLTYVAYRTNPKNQVTIHFSLSECTDDEICHEPMHHIIGGIFVKAFRLFKDETLTYSITVTDENGEQVVERQTVQAENDSERPLKTGMDHLNRMLEYLSDNDTSKLDEALVAYDRLDVITDQLFKLK